jgi:hypothetical protein
VQFTPAMPRQLRVLIVGEADNCGSFPSTRRILRVQMWRAQLRKCCARRAFGGTTEQHHSGRCMVRDVQQCITVDGSGDENRPSHIGRVVRSRYVLDVMPLESMLDDITSGYKAVSDAAPPPPSLQLG